MIYLDNAGSTFIHPSVVEAIKESLETIKGNPSSVHALGFQATKEWNRIKQSTGQMLGANPKQLVFTASGTEANNLIIQGRYHHHPTARFITTAVEHSSVLNTYKELQRRGADVVFLAVNEDGFIDSKSLENALKEAPTALVSILHTNNETGAVQAIDSLTRLAHQYGALVHYDMVQVILHSEVNLAAINCDYATFSAHKFFGPKGVGLAYIKDRASLHPHTYGGSQEYRLRAGTQNVSFAAGFLKALELTQAHRTEWASQIDELSELFIQTLHDRSIAHTLNGPPMNGARIKGTLNIAFHGVDASDLRHYLNDQAVYVSLGSACEADSVLSSHVLNAMFKDLKRVESSLRISLSPDITPHDIIELGQILETGIKKVRS